MGAGVGQLMLETRHYADHRTPKPGVESPSSQKLNRHRGTELDVPMNPAFRNQVTKPSLQLRRSLRTDNGFEG